MIQTRPASQKYLREIRPSNPHIARQMFMIRLHMFSAAMIAAAERDRRSAAAGAA